MIIKLKDLLRENKWPREILSKFPKDLQDEILDERPDPDENDIKWISSWNLRSNSPKFVSAEKLLKSNIEILERVPQSVVDIINKIWKTNVKTKVVYDQKPDRYLRYAKMTKETAKPSIMVNGEIVWGVGRWVASLVRGDDGIYVWEISTF